MQDPSQGVAPQLQPHLHLISGHKFPLIANLSLEQAFAYLRDAPSIVKQIAPMSWTYISAPQDSTLFLEWLPNKPNTPTSFPSDGYAWCDPEQTYRQDFGGYTIEMLAHTLGYRPQIDNLASHARTRYHLIAKNPSVNAAPPDPSLWLVHYRSADPQRVIPAAQAPMHTSIQRLMAQRRWLEGQGRIERRDFMLHDREHWPTITLPSMQQQQHQPAAFPPNPYTPTPQAGFRQPSIGSQQRADQQPPNKRPRTQGNLASTGAEQSGSNYDTSIEDEENTALGDYFDHCTPRDISLARYQQHHQWMEEVFSSPYASGDIVPVDLNLSLAGELTFLTDGAGREDVASRVHAFLEEGEAELVRLRERHEKEMAAWKASGAVLREAERRLRGSSEGGEEDVESVVRDFEERLGVRVVERATVTAR